MTTAIPSLELLDEMARDPLHLARAIAEMHPADLARALNSVDTPVAAHVVAALPPDTVATVLAQPVLRHPERLVEHLGERFLTPVLHTMSCASIAALLRRARPSERDRILAVIEDHRRAAVGSLLRHPPDSVAAAMTTTCLRVSGRSTVAQVRERLEALHRRVALGPDLYVVGEDGRLSHAVAILHLLQASDESHVDALAARSPQLEVAPSTSMREAAALMTHYALAALPVVADDGRLLGEVRAERALGVLIRERAEYAHTLGAIGQDDEPYAAEGLWASLYGRVRGALLALVAELAAVALAAHFVPSRGLGASLLLLLPIAIGVAGVLGMQASAMVEHSLSSGSLRQSMWAWVLRRELGLGALLGALTTTIALSMWVPAALLGGTLAGASAIPRVVLAVFGALWAVSMAGILAGAMLPFALRAMDARKRASLPLVSVLVDALGVLVYYVVALALLRAAEL